MNDDNKLKSIMKSKGFYVALVTGICAVWVLCYTLSGIRTIGNVNKDKQNELNNIEFSENDITQKPNQTEKVYENDLDNNIKNNTSNNELQNNVSENKSSLNSENTTSEAPESKETKAPEENAQKSAYDDEKDITDNMVEVMSVADNNLTFNEEEGLAWPVSGDIIMKYSMDKLVYFQTLGQFKCNPAIFISAKEGTKVTNSYESVVSKVYEDSELGNVVEVLMGNNYKLTYGQLENVSVKEGDVLKEGDTIGVVAKPTAYYTKEGAHLYFSVEQDSESVDPMLLLR